MKLYKFRSLQQLNFTLDIIHNQRLHCAVFEDLNDPFEGLFMWRTLGSGALGALGLNEVPLGMGLPKSKSTSISRFETVKHRRVCSLSASSKDVRLWSHYASGHTGVAIELELDGTDSRLHEVEYVTELRQLNVGLLNTSELDDVLKWKTHHWEYEQEFRILSDQLFYSVENQVCAIYFGIRSDPLLKKVLLDSLPHTVRAFDTRLDEKTLKILPDSQLK